MDDGWGDNKTPGGGQGMAVLDFYGNQGQRPNDGIYEGRTVNSTS